MSIVDDQSNTKESLEDATIQLDIESDYGDFANDAEELEIIDSLLSEVENGQRPDATSLLVTDIEDYEPPKGVRLPKIFGVEQSLHAWEPQPSGQVLQDSTTQNSTFSLARLPIISLTS